jgi:catechol 2,3-dioxygenase-like lactoylglutathione lyase family enzyme
VRRLPQSLAFFVEALGWKQVGAKPEYPAAFVNDGNGLITLWEARQPDTARAFDRHRNIGLHHLALRVPSELDLKNLYQRVSSWPGVEVEFAPEPSGKGPKVHFMIREPGGNRIEFAWDPR